MQKSFRFWGLVLVVIILIYLVFTNRYDITISKTEQDVIKYDRWTGKTWRVIPDKKPRYDFSKYVIETPQSKEKSQLLTIVDSLTQEYHYLIWQATEKAQLQEMVNLMKEIITQMKKLTPQELERKLEKIALKAEMPEKPVSFDEILRRQRDLEILVGKPILKREFGRELQLQELRKIKQVLME